MTNKSNLGATLTFITICLSILFLIAFAGILFIGSLISLFRADGQSTSQMILVFAYGFEIFLLVICAWFIFGKLRGKPEADLPFKFPFSLWQIFLGAGIIIISIGIGILVSLAENQFLNWLILPILTLFVIVPPIWLIYGFASNGLEFGTQWRFFSTFGIAMTIAPTLMIILEIGILLVGAIGIVFYIAIAQPQFVDQFTNLANSLSNETNQNVVLEALLPYFINPAFITILLSYIAVIVPLVEELFKPLAVWFFAKQIDTPKQGFVLGMLSGAAFALVESLNASANGSASWGLIVSIRAGTSLLHITTSGLVGWGIISLFKDKKFGRFIGAYLASVLIHGIWNAAAAGAGISVIGESIGKPEWVYTIAPAFVCGLSILLIGMLTFLMASNRKLKNERVQSSL